MAEDYKDRARKRASDRQVSIWFKLKEGDNTFRLLKTPETQPPPKGSDKKTMAAYNRRKTPAVFYEYNIHRDIGPKKVQVRCGKDAVTGEGDCWLCDTMIPKLEKTGHTTRAKAFEPRGVFAVQVASVLDDGARYNGPFIWTPSKTVADQILASIIGSKKRDYLDPKKGFNLTINRTGTGKNDTRYGIIEPDVEPSEVDPKLIAKLKPFSELKEIPVYSEDAQKAAYAGRDQVDEPDEDDVDDVEDEETEESEEDDEEPEAEDDEEEEEEEEEPPKKGKKATPVPPPVTSKKKKAAPEPEPEEEEEEEEESEEDDEEVEVDDEDEAEEEESDDEDLDVDDDDLDLDEEEEEEEEEAPPPVKKGKKAAPPPPPVKKSKRR